MKVFSSIVFLIISFFLNAQIGIIDPTFNVGTGSNNFVYHVTIQPDQKILACGNFTSFNGSTRKFVVRLNTNGSVDSSFNPEINSSQNISKVFLQPDGKIIVIGRNTDNSGYIGRLNSDGSIDNSFTSIFSFFALSDIAFTSDGKLLIAGTFNSVNGTTNKNLVRLNIDGSLDNTFNLGNTGTDNGVTSIRILSNNKILIGGPFTKYNNINRQGIARLNENGFLDEIFDPGLGANSIIFSIDEQEDHKILLGGLFTSYDGISRNFVTRINPNGSIDSSFNPSSGAGNGVSFVQKQQNGKILVSGSFTNFNDVVKNYITTLNDDGSLESISPDTSFDNAVNLCVKQNDGKLLCGGYFSTYGGVSSKGVVRIIPNNLLSTTSVFDNKIQITPNPTTDFINIKTTKLDIEKIFIHDLAGKLIYSGKSMKINVAHFPSANYIISIKTSEGVKSFKFIKI